MTTKKDTGTDSAAFGARLQHLRKLRNLTQDQLGATVGIHGRHIAKYEGGGGTLPHASTAIRLADALGVSLDALLRPMGTKDYSKAVSDADLAARLEAITNLTDENRKIVLALVDAFLAKQQIVAILGGSIPTPPRKQKS